MTFDLSISAALESVGAIRSQRGDFPLDDSLLAEAFELGRTGQTLKGFPLFAARQWHVSRRENPGYLSEGCDNPIVDWFCQGHREFDVERHPSEPCGTVALTEEPGQGERKGHPFFTVVAMLWNLTDRADLTNETSVRALLEGPKLAIEAPKTVDDLLKPTKDTNA